MTLILEYEDVGETSGFSDHDHDMMATLSRRLVHLSRSDQH